MTACQSAAPTTSPLRRVRRVLVAVVGGTVVAISIALIVLPGPAAVVIPIGLAILATEFLWARRLLRRVREGASIAKQKLRLFRSSRPKHHQ
jgi:tellurite resistance protein TerC